VVQKPLELEQYVTETLLSEDPKAKIIRDALQEAEMLKGAPVALWNYIEDSYVDIVNASPEKQSELAGILVMNIALMFVGAGELKLIKGIDDMMSKTWKILAEAEVKDTKPSIGGLDRSKVDPIPETKGTGEVNAFSRTVNIDNRDLIEHLVDGHGIGRGSRPSVKGAHNLDSFYKTIDAEASKYDLTRFDFIIGEPKPHPTVGGIYEIKYRIPSLETDYVNGGTKLKLDSNGDVVYKTAQRPKTVYATPITNEDIVKWGQEAVNGAEKAGIHAVEGINRGVAENGLKFEWLVVNGKINSIYPVF